MTILVDVVIVCIFLYEISSLVLVAKIDSSVACMWTVKYEIEMFLFQRLKHPQVVSSRTNVDENRENQITQVYPENGHYIEDGWVLVWTIWKCMGILQLSGKSQGIIKKKSCQGNCLLMATSLGLRHCLIDCCSTVLSVHDNFFTYQIILNIFSLIAYW